MADEQTEGGEKSGAETPGAPARVVGGTVNAAPDGAEKQFSWVEHKKFHRAWVLHWSSYGFKRVEAQDQKNTHYAKSPETDASLDTVKDQLGESVRGDIVTLVFHTAFAMVKGELIAFGITNSMRRDAEILYHPEMIGAVKKGSQPSALVLCGCDTARLLPGFRKLTNVPVLIGFGVDGIEEFDIAVKIISADCNAAADAITAALMRGATLNDVKAAGDAAITSKMNDLPVEVIVDVDEDVDMDESLKGNGLLPKFPA